ncbi:MAG: 30S ribosomal protein S20 [Proteobacteria bacterium]|nr:30S ribosomal protein S20 [Pseudomonadota bacterium]MBI3498996.1 30S ribosomal protein S20 [Pseudomonadota bacterium]
MANTPSAKKRVRKIARRTQINRTRISRVRSYLRKVEEAVASGDKAAAAAALKEAQPVLHGGINKGTLHRNTVARKLSRLARHINALS